MSRRIIHSLLALALACGGSETHDEHEDHDEHEEEHEHEGDRVVRIRPDAAERSGIVIAEAPEGGLPHMVEVPAEVELDPDRTAHISPIVEGRIEEVHVSIGDRVEAGDVLVVLRSVELGETRAAMAEARAALREAEAHFARQEQLVAEGIGAQRALDEARRELESTRARIQGLGQRARVYGGGGSGGRTTVRSPIAGEILTRHATVGEVAPAGRVLFEVADLSEVWVMGDVFAQDVGGIRPGASATLTLRSVPGETHSGTLDYVGPALDEHTRTLPIRMVLANEATEQGRPLRPGLFGTLHVETDTDVSPSRTSVPVGAVQPIDGVDHVFVPGDEPMEYRAVAVETGRVGPARVEIVHGLAPGDRFVAEGAFVLRSEAERESLGGHGHGH